jgi:hypothetical protein
MSIRNLAIAVLGIGLLTGCADDGTGPDPDARYLPLAVGNTWTYAPADPQFGDPVEWRVTARSGDTVTLSRPPGASHSGTVTVVDRVEAIDLLRDGTDAGTMVRFVAGSAWLRPDPWECDDGAEWAAVEETNPIETPAGTFVNTLRIERRTPASCTDAGTMMEWWAPGVGLVRWEELNFYAGGPVAFELVSYSVDG